MNMTTILLITARSVHHFKAIGQRELTEAETALAADLRQSLEPLACEDERIRRLTDHQLLALHMGLTEVKPLIESET